MRTHRVPAFLCLTAAAFTLGACASAQGALRSQPSTHFAVEDFTPPGELKDLVVVRCAAISDAKYDGKYQASTAKSPSKTSCRYVSADVTRLAGLKTDDSSPLPGMTIDLLLWISDYNCSNFLSRAFGVRSTFDLASKYIGDLASAASAGTASAAPGVSAGLDVVNLLVGKANSNFDSQFYANATFDAMESAISAERTKRKTEILAHRSTKPYSLAAALTDSRYYDDACAIKSQTIRPRYPSSQPAAAAATASHQRSASWNASFAARSSPATRRALARCAQANARSACSPCQSAGSHSRSAAATATASSPSSTAAAASPPNASTQAASPSAARRLSAHSSSHSPQLRNRRERATRPSRLSAGRRRNSSQSPTASCVHMCTNDFVLR
jgi:hypothetical protein